MPISIGLSQKKIIRMTIWLLRKKLGECATAERIHEDLENCSNPVFGLLNQLLLDTTSKIENDWQRETMEQIGELITWMIYKDTGYKDEATYLLNEILEHKEEFKKAMVGRLKPPNEWHVNAWQRSRNHTAKLTQEGKIPKGGMSEDEKIFVPARQKRKLKKYKGQ